VDKAPDAFRTISEVADDLDLPQHVLRFWETRFAQIKPMKRGGGRRYYRPEDVDVLRGIRHLLYSEGYTIRGVQRIFKDHGVKFVQTVWQAGAPQPAKAPEDSEEVESHEPTPDAGGPERRRLFGILPPLMGNGDAASEHGEPDESAGPMPPMRAPASLQDRGTLGVRAPFGAPGTPRTAPESSPAREGPQLASRDAGLSRDAVRKLQATLTELSECRRLLDAVLQEKAEA
jgi:DNA-binding transcriptional MerR regulator